MSDQYMVIHPVNHAIMLTMSASGFSRLDKRRKKRLIRKSVDEAKARMREEARLGLVTFNVISRG